MSYVVKELFATLQGQDAQAGRAAVFCRFAGCKVVFVPFANGESNRTTEDVVSRFLDSDGHAHDRPVALALDKEGALLIADNVGNAVWRVTGGSQKQAARTD